MRFALDQHLRAPHGRNKLKTETVNEPEARLGIYSKSKSEKQQNQKTKFETQLTIHCAMWRVPPPRPPRRLRRFGDTAAAAAGSAVRIVSIAKV